MSKTEAKRKREERRKKREQKRNPKLKKDYSKAVNKTIEKSTKILLLGLFLVGILLLLLNTLGMIIGMKHPLAENQEFRFTEDMDDRYEGESDWDYATRMTALVDSAMTHNVEIDLVVPIQENYILWWKGINKESRYRIYEFADWRKALNRGIGWCSQHATALMGLLNENGLQSFAVGMGGHTVINTRHFTLDPDTGVVMDHNIGEIEQNPEFVRPYYKAIESRLIEEFNLTVDRIVEIYEKEHNYYRQNTEQYYRATIQFEKDSYLWIWLIPLILIIPYIIFRILRRLL